MENYGDMLLGICIFAILPGFIAKAKGRSFWGYYFLGVLFSPLVSLIVVIFLKSLTPNNINHSTESPVTVVVKSAEDEEDNSIATELKKYKKLVEEDLITEEEYEAKKKQLLGL